MFPDATFYFYRTINGAEIDYVVKVRNKIFAIECKSGLLPSLSKGNYNAIEDVHPNYTFIVCPVEMGWQLKNGIDIVSLTEIEDKIRQLI